MFEGIHEEKNSELKSEIKPIEIHVGTISDFKGTDNPVDFFIKNKDIVDKLSTTNFGSDKKELDAKKALHAGKSTYVISTIDELNKFEKEIYMCTVLIVVGKDKNSGQNVSFVSHQYPGEFLNGKKKDFTDHLKERLLEFKGKCEKDTIEAVVVGGKDYKPLKTKDPMSEWYTESIKLLEEQIENILKIKPKAVNGPKHNNEKRPDLVIFETQKRRLYLIRPEINIEN